MVKLRVNFLCFIGVAIGFIALMGSWGALNSWFAHSMDPEWQNIWTEKLGSLIVPPMLFLIGTLIAIVTPLGGIIQSIGIVDFLIRTGESGYQYTLKSYPYYSDNLTVFTIFLAIGMASSIVVLYSMRSPIWMSRDDHTFPRSHSTKGIFQRLLTFQIIREKPSEEA
jgi:hypothetical protein